MYLFYSKWGRGLLSDDTENSLAIDPLECQHSFCGAESNMFPSPFDEAGVSDIDKQEQILRGAPLKLICSITEGEPKLVELDVYTGQDVAYAKVLMANQLDLDYEKIQLFIGDKLMFDPLSFADFPELNGTSQAAIVVKILDL